MLNRKMPNERIVMGKNNGGRSVVVKPGTNSSSKLTLNERYRVKVPFISRFQLLHQSSKSDSSIQSRLSLPLHKRVTRGGSQLGASSGRFAPYSDQKVSSYNRPASARERPAHPQAGAFRGKPIMRKRGNNRVSLDKELDAYMLADEKTAQGVLDADLEAYMKSADVEMV